MGAAVLKAESFAQGWECLGKPPAHSVGSVSFATQNQPAPSQTEDWF